MKVSQQSLRKEALPRHTRTAEIPVTPTRHPPFVQRVVHVSNSAAKEGFPAASMIHAHVTTPHTAGIVSLRLLVSKQHKHKSGPGEILRGVGVLHPPPCISTTSAAQVRHKCRASAGQVRGKCGTSAEQVRRTVRIPPPRGASWVASHHAAAAAGDLAGGTANPAHHTRML